MDQVKNNVSRSFRIAHDPLLRDCDQCLEQSIDNVLFGAKSLDNGSENRGLGRIDRSIEEGHPLPAVPCHGHLRTDN